MTRGVKACVGDVVLVFDENLKRECWRMEELKVCNWEGQGSDRSKSESD